MIFKTNNNSLQRLEADLDKKYLSSGLRISGDKKNDKLTLYLIDDYGKHSAFLNEYFYGKIEQGRITGNFRISNYALLLLGILLGFVIESLISAFIFKSFEGIALPLIICAAEVLYCFWLKRNSKMYNSLISNYLENLCDGDEFDSEASE